MNKNEETDWDNMIKQAWVERRALLGARRALLGACSEQIFISKRCDALFVASEAESRRERKTELCERIYELRVRETTLENTIIPLLRKENNEKEINYLNKVHKIARGLAVDKDFRKYAVMYDKIDTIKDFIPDSAEEFVRLNSRYSQAGDSGMLSNNLFTGKLIPQIDKLKTTADLPLCAINAQLALQSYNLPPEVVHCIMTFSYNNSSNRLDHLEVSKANIQNKRLSAPFFSQLARKLNDASEFEQYTALNHGGDKRKAGAMVIISRFKR